MTTPELPPLPKPQEVYLYEGVLDYMYDVEAVDAAVEARERILQARIAELEADAERYRWLRDNGKPAAEGLVMSAPEHWDAAIDAAREAK